MRPTQTPATNAIALVTAAIFVLLLLFGLDQAADLAAGFIPARLNGLVLGGALPVWVTPVTATLLHGGFLHLVFNMVMLIFCGRMVEEVIGPGRLVLLYLIGAYGAAMGQYIVNPADGTPMIGASGAISAVFGGYALLYGQPKKMAGHPWLVAAVNVLWLAAAWIGVQFLMGFAFADIGMAIATGAHIGGFITGLVLIYPLVRSVRPRSLQ